MISISNLTIFLHRLLHHNPCQPLSVPSSGPSKLLRHALFSESLWPGKAQTSRSRSHVTSCWESSFRFSRTTKEPRNSFERRVLGLSIFKPRLQRTMIWNMSFPKTESVKKAKWVACNRMKVKIAEKLVNFTGDSLWLQSSTLLECFLDNLLHQSSLPRLYSICSVDCCRIGWPGSPTFRDTRSLGPLNVSFVSSHLLPCFQDTQVTLWSIHPDQARGQRISLSSSGSVIFRGLVLRRLSSPLETFSVSLFHAPVVVALSKATLKAVQRDSSWQTYCTHTRMWSWNHEISMVCKDLSASQHLELHPMKIRDNYNGQPYS